MKNPSDLNKWEKEVYGSLLKDEKEVLEELKKMYESALNDIMDQVKSFDADISSLDELLQLAPDEAAGKILNLQQSKIYQKQYQEALQGQIQGILDRLNSEEYTSIDEYMKGCYEEGWTGSAYVLAQQGIPIITPIDQAAMTRAVLLDSKISNGLYEHLGVDVANLKKRITQEISRGIATGMSYRDIARNLNNTSKTGLSNAMRIVRTEGHRIQQQSWKDSAVNAKDHGADLVRVWSAVLDGRTRPTHRLYDGTITEVTEPFHLPNGKVVDRPSDFGDPSEDCNCRCVALIKPRWALEAGVIKMDNFTGQLRTFNSYDDYEKFKEDYWSDENIKYMQYVQKMEEKYGTTDFSTMIGSMTEQEYKHFFNLENENPMWNRVDEKGRLKLFSFNGKRIDKNPPQPLSREESNRILVEKLGFTNVEDNVSKIPEDVLSANVEQLNALEERFRILEHSELGYFSATNERGSEAYVECSITNPAKQSLVLCSSAHSSMERLNGLIDSEIASNHAMPCLIKNYPVYNVTHEYGHMLQNVLIRNAYINNGWDASNPRAFVDFTKKTDAARLKWYNNISKQVEKSCYDDIINIALQNNPDFKIVDNISRYGKTNYGEFFAEVFANSQLGKPNELGDAMNIWLKQKGLLLE